MKVLLLALAAFSILRSLANASESIVPTQDYRIVAGSVDGVQETAFGPTEPMLASESGKFLLYLMVDGWNPASARISPQVTLHDSNGNTVDVTSVGREGFNTSSTGISRSASRVYAVERDTLDLPLSVTIGVDGDPYRYKLDRTIRETSRVETHKATTPDPSNASAETGAALSHTKPGVRLCRSKAPEPRNVYRRFPFLAHGLEFVCARNEDNPVSGMFLVRDRAGDAWFRILDVSRNAAQLGAHPPLAAVYMDFAKIYKSFDDIPIPLSTKMNGRDDGAGFVVLPDAMSFDSTKDVFTVSFNTSWKDEEFLTRLRFSKADLRKAMEVSRQSEEEP